MASMDEFLIYVQQIDPLWSVALVAAALAVLLVWKLWRTSFAYAFIGALAVLAVGAIAGGGFYGYSYLEDQRRFEERRVLDERVEILFSKAIEPDSVFACIDGSPAPAMLEACERNLFAEPQRVAAAVAIVTQRLIFLNDALTFARQRDRSYAERIAPMRNAIESDPYGFVAFVLSVEHGCTHEKCGRFALMRDAKRIRDNMRSRRLEAYMAKHSASWRGGEGTPAPATASARGSAPLITISGDPATPRPPATEQPKEKEASALTPEIPAPAEAAASPAPALPLETPAAALAPILTPPTGSSFSETPRETTAPAAASSKGAAKNPAEAAKGAADAAKSAPRPAQSAASPQKAKAKAAADPVTRRSSEPVAGLPRVVPSDYKREAEEKEATAQKEKEAASAQSAVRQQPGAPVPITPPAQNFTGN